MFPSYQTVPLANVPTKANAPKEERSSTPVPRRKKVAVAAAMMVGMAVLVVGYSYGASTTHPARIDIATTTENLVPQPPTEVPTQFPYRDLCYDVRDKWVCKNLEFFPCYWYPHYWSNPQGMCSSFKGVDCGGHRAITCNECPYYDSREDLGPSFCNGECKWYNSPDGEHDSYCEDAL